MSDILNQYEKIQNIINENKKYIGQEVVNIKFEGDNYGFNRGKLFIYKSYINDISHEGQLKYHLLQCNSNRKRSMYQERINKTLFLSEDSFKTLLHKVLIDKESIKTDGCVSEGCLLSLKNMSRKKNFLDNLKNLNKDCVILRLSYDINNKCLALYGVEVERVTDKGISFNDDSIVSNPNDLLKSGYYALDNIKVLINDIMRELYRDDSCASIKNNLNENFNTKFNEENTLNNNTNNFDSSKMDRLIEDKIRKVILSDEFIDRVSRNIVSIIKSKL